MLVKKNVGQKKFGSKQKNLKTFIGQNKIWVKHFLAGKKILIKKNLGQKKFVEKKCVRIFLGVNFFCMYHPVWLN